MVDEETLSGKLEILRLWFGKVRTGEAEFTDHGRIVFETLLAQCQGEALVLEQQGKPVAEPSTVVSFRRTVAQALKTIDAAAAAVEPTGGAA